MRNKMMWTGICVGVVIGALLATAGIALAGSLNPSAGPAAAGSQMFTLEQIWQRLTSGAAGTKMTAFTEPAAGPGAGSMHTLDDIMTAAPALDATNGATTANVVRGKTFWGLTSGQWGLRTGAAYPALVPRTGDGGTCFRAGDDCSLRLGVIWPNPRFTVNGDGTVTDNLTGLIWLQNANCWTTRNVAASINAVAALASGTCGLTDGSTAGQWRLPNAREMLSLIFYNNTNPAIPNTAGTGKWTAGNPFNNVLSAYYWTSTSNPDNSLFYLVYFNDGTTRLQNVNDSFNVWAVRGPTP